MASKCPRISVIMSVFNGELYLRESIDTILNQTYSDFEFIIIDDCSTDLSLKIVKEYSILDSRVKLISNTENLGLTRSLNKALQVAKGEYIARQDADDVALPTRLDKQLEVLDRLSNVVLVSCNVAVIDADGNPFDAHYRSCHSNLVPWYLLFYNHLAGHSQVMYRLSTVERIGGYAESRPYSQDYELWSRISSAGKILILPEVLQKQRMHCKSVSATKRSDQSLLSLVQSQINISQLLNEELSLEELACIRRFWTGSYWWSSFPYFHKANSIHFRIKALYEAFIQQPGLNSYTDVDVSCQLRSLIAQQFVSWMQSTKVFSYSRIKLSYFTFLWNPTALLHFWFDEFWNAFRDKLTVFYKIVSLSQVKPS